MKFKRIFLMIIDSLGVGEARDANLYHDEGTNTLKHIKEGYDLYTPNLEKLGLYNTLTLNDEDIATDAYYTIMRPNNSGKDSLSGHYEILGIALKDPFKNFESAFPSELVQNIETITRTRIIGNKRLCSEDALNEFGKTSADYGTLILFHDEDSTLHLAAHEDQIPIQNLLNHTKNVRKLTELNPMWRVGRVIARPFTGKEKYRFTSDRVDYTFDPPIPNVLTKLKDKNLSVISIGKISDIMNESGITKKIAAGQKNSVTINKLNDIMDKEFEGLCIVNFDEFNNYGHQRELSEMANTLEELDVEIPMILNKLNPDDLLIITSNRGADPLKEGKNHTRENVPLILYSRAFKESGKLPLRETMGDIAATICDNFDLEPSLIGSSILEHLK